MMQRFEKQEFDSWIEPCSILAYQDMEFVKCKFWGRGFGYPHSRGFSRRTRATNIRIVDCQARKCLIGPAMLEDIHIENLNSDVTIVWGALFKHVTIKGRCDKLMIHGITGRGDIDVGGKGVLPYRALCDEFYKSVDWALDIREAEFEDFCIRTRGVPVQLVRRDPETQAVVSRDKAIEGKWRELGLSGLTQIFFKDVIEEAPPAAVLIAPKRHKRNFQEVLTDIRRLREAGIADPD